MNADVTVDEALRKGHRMLSYPGIFILFGLLGLSIAISVRTNSAIGTAVTLLLAFLLPWLCWSIMVPRWKIWAFGNVRNVHELKRRAIQEKLIWDDDSFFNKTEIWNASQREQWSLIQLKFERKDEFIFEEDLTVPAVTIIYYSRGKNLLEMFFMIGMLAFGIYLVATSGRYIIGGIFIIMGCYLAIKEYKEATNKDPQIIIDENGMQTISAAFCEWKDIENEEVEIEGSGKHTHYYLKYQHKNGAERLLIDEYETDHKQLRKLLKIYRGRNLKKNGYH